MFNYGHKYRSRPNTQDNKTHDRVNVSKIRTADLNITSTTHKLVFM